MMAPSGPRSWQFADKGRPQAYTRILAYVCVNQKYRHNILVTRRRSVSLCCTRPNKLCVVHFLSLMISRIPSVIISPKIHLKKRCILSQDVFSSLSFFLCSLLSLHLAGPLHLSILRESRVFNFFFFWFLLKNVTCTIILTTPFAVDGTILVDYRRILTSTTCTIQFLSSSNAYH